MPQHDLNIANQLFPQTRQDLNNVISALASNNAGPVAPTVTLPGMTWFDNAQEIIKIRNTANTAWVNVFDVKNAAAFAPGPPGPKGDKGDPGVSPILPDFSQYMLKMGGRFTGEIGGPIARFDAFTGGSGGTDLWWKLIVGDFIGIVARSADVSPLINFYHWDGSVMGMIYENLNRADSPNMGSLVFGTRWRNDLPYQTYTMHNNGNFYSALGFVGTSFTPVSDGTVKREIKNVGYVGNELINLRVREYTRTDNKRKQIGLVAQEVMEDIGKRWPWLVNKEPNGLLSVDWTSLMALMLRWMQELHVRTV